MSRLEDLEAFIHIAEAGSLTKAARRLNRTLQAVSRSLAALEEDASAALLAALAGVQGGPSLSALLDEDWLPVPGRQRRRGPPLPPVPHERAGVPGRPA